MDIRLTISVPKRPNVKGQHTHLLYNVHTGTTGKITSLKQFCEANGYSYQYLLIKIQAAGMREGYYHSEFMAILDAMRERREARRARAAAKRPQCLRCFGSGFEPEEDACTP